jgi:hypothetical protein
VIFLFQLDTTHHVNAFPISEASSFRVQDMLQWLVCSVGAAEYIESLFVLLSRTAAERRYLWAIAPRALESILTFPF